MGEFSKTYQPEQRGDPHKGGKANGKRQVMTDALMLALHEEVDEVSETGVKTKRLNQIARKLAAKAAEGDVQAIKEVFDRTQGKAMQAMELSGKDGEKLDTTFIFNPVGPTHEPD